MAFASLASLTLFMPLSRMSAGGASLLRDDAKACNNST